MHVDAGNHSRLDHDLYSVILRCLSLCNCTLLLQPYHHLHNIQHQLHVSLYLQTVQDRTRNSLMNRCSSLILLARSNYLHQTHNTVQSVFICCLCSPHYETQESLFQKDMGSSACGGLVAQIAGEGGQSILGECVHCCGCGGIIGIPRTGWM